VLGKKDETSLEGTKILLVEDNLLNQELVKELIENQGSEVYIANNGQEALDILLKQDKVVDCVLMDVQMPIMDGYAAAEQLRESEKMNNIPIIAMTANAMRSDREKALSVGMNDYIAKPFDAVDLFKLIKKWIKKSAHSTGENEVFGNDVNEFPELKGIDTEHGMKVCNQNLKLYKKILKVYFISNKDFESQYLASSGSEEILRLAHSLKGTSANIGALEISNLSSELAAACKNDESKEVLSNCFENLLESLNTTLSSLADYLKESSIESK